MIAWTRGEHLSPTGTDACYDVMFRDVGEVRCRSNVTKRETVFCWIKHVGFTLARGRFARGSEHRSPRLSRCNDDYFVRIVVELHFGHR